jgi:protein-tyrosine phosphatase
MKILICSQREAIKYLPEDESYGIQIFSGYLKDRNKEKLMEHPKWVHIAQYSFDDTYPGDPMEREGVYVLFNKKIAQNLLEEFMQHRKDSKTLLVHCGQGLNRSPAVAIALNEIFKLGENTQKLIDVYEEMNGFVFNTLLEEARGLRFY